MMPNSLSQADRQRLADLDAIIQREGELHVGFPWNSKFDYSPLLPFLSYPINNDGDPYAHSNYHLNTHEFEREVLATFAELTEAPADSYWGYVTSGSTEGNLYGLFLARELYENGIFYCSEETFAMQKLLRCLRVRSVIVHSQSDGCVDLDHLAEVIEPRRDKPAIILANIGTTLKGAVDDLPGIHRVLDDLGVEDRYVHADAAFSGMILPFVDDAPPWNFAAGIDSLSTSWHKMVGSPLPCGLVIAEKSKVDAAARASNGTSRLDTTILASRNAITPLFMWYTFRTIGLEGLRERVVECSKVADYAIDRLEQIGWHAWRHPYSTTVVFDRPSDAITTKWQLFAQGDTAHLIALPHITRERIDAFIDELERDPGSQSRPQLADSTLAEAEC